MKRLFLLVAIMTIITAVAVGVTSTCYAEEIPAEVPTEEVAPAEPPVEQPTEDNKLQGTLGFLDMPMTTLIMSFLGSSVGMAIVSFILNKAGKKVSQVITDLFSKKDELAKVGIEVEIAKTELMDTKLAIEKFMNEHADELAKIAKMIEVGFCVDPDKIADGTADKIKEISGVENDELKD